MPPKGPPPPDHLAGIAQPGWRATSFGGECPQEDAILGFRLLACTNDILPGAGFFPEFLEVSVAGLEVGDTLHSNDIKLPAGVSLTSRDNLTLVTIVPPTVDAEPEAAAETEAAKA